MIKIAVLFLVFMVVLCLWLANPFRKRPRDTVRCRSCGAAAVKGRRCVCGART